MSIALFPKSQISRVLFRMFWSKHLQTCLRISEMLTNTITELAMAWFLMITSAKEFQAKPALKRPRSHITVLLFGVRHQSSYYTCCLHLTALPKSQYHVYRSNDFSSNHDVVCRLGATSETERRLNKETKTCMELIIKLSS